MKDLKTETNIESFTGLMYQIVKRKGVKQLSKYLKKYLGRKKANWVYKKAGRDLLLSWCHLFILGAGDVGMYNVLVQKKEKKLHIIDFEESRGKDNKREDDPGLKLRNLEAVAESVR